ncbi:gremlin-2-like [Onthophagus taurus]|uniref:gremlin-2-like n=1 Tax=Onthophagus taurus TaxID=166361 RepID=UPI000C20CD21|nr:gremlin-2-like [Onthophagus taurus]
MNFLGTFVILLQTILTALSVRDSQSDSIADIINTKEVEKLIAERQENEAKSERRYLLENELDENPPDPEYEYQRFVNADPDPPRTENPRIEIDLLMRRSNTSDPFKGTDLLNDLRGYNGRNILKSSKNALYITKKEYLQKDWCKTEPLVQKVKEEGCITRTVINRFCYGQCNSFYIPKNPKKKNRKRTEENEEEDENGPAFKSCSFCKPKKFTWVSVTLKCPGLSPPYKRKRIQRIKQCRCGTIDA